MGYQPVLNVTLKANAELEPKRFVTGAGTYAPSGGTAYGVTIHAADKDELTTIVVMGIAEVEAQEPINPGDFVTPGEDGKARVANSGEWIVGVALTSASGAGDVVEVLLKSFGTMPTT